MPEKWIFSEFICEQFVRVKETGKIVMLNGFRLLSGDVYLYETADNDVLIGGDFEYTRGMPA